MRPTKGARADTIVPMSNVWVWQEVLFKKADTSPSPKVVPNLTDVAKVVAGRGSLIALQSDGTVQVWKAERDAFSDNGDGIPVATVVPNLTDVTDVFSADGANYAIKSDGTLWAWGENHSGQLGDGTMEPRDTPVRVMNLNGVVSVTTEKSSTFAVKT
ncbi:MAG: repeat domain protein, partial [Spirosoma sp.]|nr:repeat domain protein [Spirosoma sp.]